jgi:hypothetical protein
MRCKKDFQDKRIQYGAHGRAPWLWAFVRRRCQKKNEQRELDFAVLDLGGMPPRTSEIA